jgi:hypothetical protein
LTWFQVSLHGDFNFPRCNHVTSLSGSKLFIFGGHNSNGFLGNKITYFEFDKDKIKEYIK